MLNKQNLWFITLFTLILVLGVYYVTMPNDVLKEIQLKTEEKKQEKKEQSVQEESSLSSLRVSKETSRQEKIESLETSLTKENLTTEEKNNTYELLKYLNEVQGKEENFEKKLKKDFGLDCYTKIENTDATVICVSKTHDTSLANKIMRTIQKEYQDKMNITVKFQEN